jgi:hypothetical protein
LLVLVLLTLPAQVQAQFTFTNNNGAITITGYTGYSSDIVIPSSINGLPVTSIGTSAFLNYDGVNGIGGPTSVIIPSSVSSIGSAAFLYCVNLVSVTMSNGVSNIGDGAFFNCKKLDAVTIPNTVTNIGSFAFEQCGLTNVLIPGSVMKLGDAVFSGCYHLTNIAVDALNSNYVSVGDVLFDKTLTTLIEYPASRTGNYVIPEGVASIEGSAFAMSPLTNVIIPNNVTNIGNYVFLSCPNLTGLTISSNVTGIGDGILEDCPSLTNVTVDALNPNFASSAGVLFNKTLTTLIACPAAKSGSYVIPGSVTLIEGFAFEFCNLSSITIPEGTTEIGDYSFFSCTNLTTANIPNSVTNIGDNAFDSCDALTNLIIPASVTSIGNRTFFDCSALTNLTIAEGVANIGDSAFSSCSALTSLTIPASVTRIGNNAFDYCLNLTNVTILGNLASLGNGAFADCLNLSNVYFQGNAPGVDLGGFLDDTGTIYYLPGTTGWSSHLDVLPTVLRYLPYPVILNRGSNFGIQTNGFGFVISWATNQTVVVAACTNLFNPAWQPVQTNTQNGGTSYFSDSQWTNYPVRFYRVGPQ